MIIVGIGLGVMIWGIVLFGIAFNRRRKERRIERMENMREQIRFWEDYNKWKMNVDEEVDKLTRL